MSARAEYLLSMIANCKANLDKPNVRYPNGRMSHDVESEYLDQLQAEWFDHVIEHGLFDLQGHLVAFADTTACQ
jgi:uncharacterized protein YqiB (DUF1249 family)